MNLYKNAAFSTAALVFIFTMLAAGNAAAEGGFSHEIANDNKSPVICPECYDFKTDDNKLYFSKDASLATIKKIKKYVVNAKSAVKEYYSDFADDTTLFVCTNRKCDRKVGFANHKNHKAISVGSSFIFISSQGIKPEIFTHEFAHIALHKLLASRNIDVNAVPIWFDEGLSVFIAKDKRYLKHGENGLAACKYPDIANLPISEEDWNKDSIKSKELYGKSACAVSIWAEDANNDKKAIYNKIINRIGNGSLSIAD